MTIKDSDLFREATLKFCISLEIEKALYTFFLYIRRFIPAGQVSLHTGDLHPGLLKLSLVLICPVAQPSQSLPKSRKIPGQRGKEGGKRMLR